MASPSGCSRSPSPPIPEALLAAHSGWRTEVAYQSFPAVITYRLTNPGADTRYLKVAELGCFPTLASEADRMRWARSHLPVPLVVDHGADERVQWLLTEALPGADGTAERWRPDPEIVVERLAKGLRRFHEAPVSECPFDFTLDSALTLARDRLGAGLIEPARDFHPEFAHLSAAQALRFLSEERPRSEDLVVCHGDYCAPNVLLEEEKGVTGFVDLGELGVADRWWDLAVATWSVTWNFGPGLEERFLAEYGVPRDPQRTEYYRLLYDVVS